MSKPFVSTVAALGYRGTDESEEAYIERFMDWNGNKAKEFMYRLFMEWWDCPFNEASQWDIAHELLTMALTTVPDRQATSPGILKQIPEEIRRAVEAVHEKEAR